MIFSWSCASFGFFLIPFFLSSINTELAEGSLNVFQLAIASSIAEILACFFTSFITYFFHIKRCLTFSFALAFAGSVWFALIQDSVTKDPFIIYYILFSKFGITVAFNLSYAIMA